MPDRAKKRVLIVDDSVVVRKILSDLLAEDPDLEAAGVAGNGKIGLVKFTSLHPDLVLLDVEMPEMNGLETLAELRKLDPRVPIIMFSALTDSGAETTLQALSLGATDYCTKPSLAGSPAQAIAHVRAELLPKIKTLCKVIACVAAPRAVVRPPQVPVVRLPRKMNVVAIGTSTGGPNALAEVIPTIPAGFPVPIVIVQHMPPVFTRQLAERLTKLSSIPVHEAAEGDLLQPGQAWLAPGGSHMVLARDGENVRVHLTTTPPENFCRPAVDPMFRSVAQVYGLHALAVVLTGMGSDGLLGSKAILQAGGDIILQDEATSVVWGMPGSIYQAGVSDRVFPLSLITTEIARLVSWGRTFAAAP